MNTTVQLLPTVTPVRPVTPHRPALRLINTKTLSRDAWLNVRRQVIGSRDAVAAAVLQPCRPPWQHPLQANERASWRRTIHRKAMAPKFMVRA